MLSLHCTCPATSCLPSFKGHEIKSMGRTKRVLLMDTAVAMRLSKTCLKQGTVVMKVKTYLPSMLCLLCAIIMLSLLL